MSKSTPRYSDEFKSEAVALFLSERRTYAEVSSQLGVSKTALQRWVTLSQALPDADRGSGSARAAEAPDLAKYRALEARVRELEKENGFLKKVSAFFAREQP